MGDSRQPGVRDWVFCGQPEGHVGRARCTGGFSYTRSGHRAPAFCLGYLAEMAQVSATPYYYRLCHSLIRNQTPGRVCMYPASNNISAFFM